MGKWAMIFKGGGSSSISWSRWHAQMLSASEALVDSLLVGVRFSPPKPAQHELWSDRSRAAYKYSLGFRCAASTQPKTLHSLEVMSAHAMHTSGGPRKRRLSKFLD